MKLELDTSCNVSQREANYLNVYDLERKINERMNKAGNELMENVIKELLDKRPRYSKWIPVKVYMKFHTIGVQRGKVECIREIGKGYKLVQENIVSLERKK